jgi:hypothetical protein
MSYGNNGGNNNNRQAQFTQNQFTQNQAQPPTHPHPQMGQNTATFNQPAYGQPQYQQPQAPQGIDPNQFFLPSAEESQSDFRGWPQNVEGPFNLEVILVDPPQIKTEAFQKPGALMAYHQLIGQGVPEQAAIAQSGVALQVPIKFEVFGVNEPYSNEDGQPVDMNGLTVQVWFNPSMNPDSFMYNLIKAIKHGKVDRSERLNLSFLLHSRTIGMVNLGKPRMREGQAKPVRFPTVKSFSPYRGELLEGSAQHQFLSGQAALNVSVPQTQPEQAEYDSEVPF